MTPGLHIGTGVNMLPLVLLTLPLPSLLHHRFLCCNRCDNLITLAFTHGVFSMKGPKHYRQLEQTQYRVLHLHVAAQQLSLRQNEKCVLVHA